jgi:tRNA G18 (ribose-2'-O)-methylase SpoU
MPRVPIDDLDDPRIAIFGQLKATRQPRFRHLFVAEGELLFERVCESRFPLVSVLVTKSHEARIAARVGPEIPLYVVPDDLIHALVGFPFHRGVLCCARRRPWPDLTELVPPSPSRSTVIVCPRLDNPENLGTIIRIAHAFGIDLALLGPRAPDPFSRRVLRVSMGSSLQLSVIAADCLERDLEHLASAQGYELVAAVLDTNAEPLDVFKRPGRLALLLGSEAGGLPAAWLARCPRHVTIPMRQGVDSLNVAVATGILLYRMMHVTNLPES